MKTDPTSKQAEASTATDSERLGVVLPRLVLWRDITAGETVKPGDRIINEDGDWKIVTRTFVFEKYMWPVQRQVILPENETAHLTAKEERK
jgi:hypothetical protein